MGTTITVGSSIVEQPQYIPQINDAVGLNKNQWLNQKHPSYLYSEHEWRRHERAAHGGNDVGCWLKPFDWEVDEGQYTQHYHARRNELTWLNFGDRFATLIVGHMMREAPKPDFGTLGIVSRKKSTNIPTPAELIAFNTDGVGQDGSQWDNFWTAAFKNAVYVGHQYIWAHGPKDEPVTRADEIAGKRPYLECLSPLSVINWLDIKGTKQFVIVKRWVRNPVVLKDGSWDNNYAVPEYVLMTREGCHIFDAVDPEFSIGGWFTFNYEGELQQDQTGFWKATNGEIPLFTLYYERVKKSSCPAISRSGIAQMVNADISYMNLASAADYEVWDSGTSIKTLNNVDSDGHNLFIEKVKKGNKFVPLLNKSNPQANTSIGDASGNQAASQSFDTRLRAKRNEALEFMLNEIQIAPDSSGVARAASFTDVREPRLALMAAEIETTQNSVIDALERLWGSDNPSGSVEWPRKFRLIEPLTVANEFFGVENLANVRSPTAGAKILTASARDTGVIGDDEEETTVHAEYLHALRVQADATAQQASLIGAVNIPAGVPSVSRTKPAAPAPTATKKSGGTLTTDIIRGPDGQIKQMVQSRKKNPVPPIVQQNSGQRNAGGNN